MKFPRLPSDSKDDHDGRSRIEGWSTGAVVQGTKAGGIIMVGKEKRMSGVQNDRLAQGTGIHRSGSDGGLVGLMVSIEKQGLKERILQHKVYSRHCGMCSTNLQKPVQCAVGSFSKIH
jgi:hypothetical protein